MKKPALRLKLCKECKLLSEDHRHSLEEKREFRKIWKGIDEKLKFKK